FPRLFGDGPGYVLAILDCSERAFDETGQLVRIGQPVGPGEAREVVLFIERFHPQEDFARIFIKGVGFGDAGPVELEMRGQRSVAGPAAQFPDREISDEDKRDRRKGRGGAREKGNPCRENDDGEKNENRDQKSGQENDQHGGGHGKSAPVVRIPPASGAPPPPRVKATRLLERVLTSLTSFPSSVKRTAVCSSPVPLRVRSP